MKKLGILSTIFLLVIAYQAEAQKKENGKIKIELSKEVNGEKKTFQGEYNTTEEMYADPRYQEFAGADHAFNFWFNGDKDQHVFMQLDKLNDMQSSAFHFFSDKDSSDSGNYVFHRLDADSLDGFLNLYLKDLDLDEYSKHMRQLGIEIERIFDQLDDDGVMRQFHVITIKQIRVEDNIEEFGKRGKVADSKQLELSDLSFFPNPAPNGKLQLRFSVSEKADLTVQVSNFDGKTVYSRYLENYSGIYRESLDLSDQKPGIYLLEIINGDKKLAKKIVIEE